jgi:hypothetical protein
MSIRGILDVDLEKALIKRGLNYYTQVSFVFYLTTIELVGTQFLDGIKAYSRFDGLSLLLDNLDHALNIQRERVS